MAGCSKRVGKSMTKEEYGEMRYQEYLELTQTRDVWLNVYIKELTQRRVELIEYGFKISDTEACYRIVESIRSRLRSLAERILNEMLEISSYEEPNINYQEFCNKVITEWCRVRDAYEEVRARQGLIKMLKDQVEEYERYVEQCEKQIQVYEGRRNTHIKCIKADMEAIEIQREILDCVYEEANLPIIEEDPMEWYDAETRSELSAVGVKGTVGNLPPLDFGESRESYGSWSPSERLYKK